MTRTLQAIVPTINKEMDGAAGIRHTLQLFGNRPNVPETFFVTIGYDAEHHGFTQTINDMIIGKNAWNGVCDYLFLNDDIEPLSLDWNKFFAFVSSHPNAGIIGFKIFSDREKKHIYHAGCQQAYPFGVHKGGNTDTFNKPTREQWVNFSVVFVRNELIREIGVLDNNFKMFFSDSDYCYTARARGWDVWFVPYLEFYHEIGVSGRLEGNMLDQFLLDKQYFERKWFGENPSIPNRADPNSPGLVYADPTGLYRDLTSEILEE